MEFVEWEPSQPAALPTAEQTEPTADSEPEPKAKSDQVHEPATVSVTEGILVEFAGMDWSPAHTTVAEVHAKSWVSTDLFELDEEIFSGLLLPLVQSSPKSTSSMLVQPSSKSSPTSVSSSSTKSVSSPLVVSPSFPLTPLLPRPSSSLAPPSMAPSKPVAPPRPVDKSAPPWLLPLSAPPGTVILMAPPGSLVPMALPWSVIALWHRLPGLQLRFIPPLLWHRWAPSQSIGALAPPRLLVFPFQPLQGQV